MVTSARDRGWGRLAAVLLAIVALAPAVIASTSIGTSRGPEEAAGTSAATPVGSAACRGADLPAAHVAYADWQRTILSPVRVLPAGYTPPDLASAGAASFDPQWRVRSLLIDDLAALNAAAAADGVQLQLTSAYRSEADQRAEFDHAVAELGPDEAAREVARPGHSEHQLGTTLDFRDTGDAYAWLTANAWRFGFVQSFNGDPVGCMVREPWHFRYLGRSLARGEHSSGLALNDFLVAEFGP